MRGIVILATALVVGGGAAAQEIDWKKIDDTLGRSAAVTGDVHRYGFPRTDLNVTLDGVTIKPALALGGWTAFKPVHGSAMMMGDLVLLESEITPVMTAAIENGLEITAIHNHVLRAHPATFYMHVSGHGDPVKLANALHTALAASKTPLTSPSAAAAADVALTRQNSTVSSASKANPWAAFINSVFPDEIPLPRMECLWIRLPRLVWPPASISNQRAMAKRR
jgi:hypothetical protein